MNEIVERIDELRDILDSASRSEIAQSLADSVKLQDIATEMETATGEEFFQLSKALEGLDLSLSQAVSELEALECILDMDDELVDCDGY